jgi:hypothetical protein
MNTRATLLLIAWLGACSPNTRLEDLRGAALALKLSASSVSLYIHPPAHSKGGTKAELRKISTSAKASFNGQPLKRLVGIYAVGDLAYDRAHMLEFAFPGSLMRDRGGPETEHPGPIPAAARSTGAALVRIEDASATWTLTVPDAFTSRTLSLESPAGNEFRRGDRVVLRWSPASDVLLGKYLRLRLQQPGRAGEGVVVGSDGVTIEGARLSFTVPHDVPEHFTGPIQLQVLGPSVFEPKRSACPVASCQVWIEASIDAFSATLR